MAIKYIPFNPKRAAELNGNVLAELIFEYLILRSNLKGAKDSDGWFKLTIAELESTLVPSEGSKRGVKRYAQSKARQLLINKGWIECRLSSGRSPTLEFRVIHRNCG